MLKTVPIRKITKEPNLAAPPFLCLQLVSYHSLTGSLHSYYTSLPLFAPRFGELAASSSP